MVVDERLQFIVPVEIKTKLLLLYRMVTQRSSSFLL